jgi:hypothetical protein
MRTTALLFSVVVALSATSVRAENPVPANNVVKQQRGFLSALGLGLLIGGLAGIGAGIGGVIGANEAESYLILYRPTASAAEQPTVNALEQRAKGDSTLAAVGFIGGGLALVGGIICLAVDTPRASVAFVPTSQGGVFVFTGRF